MTVAVADIIRRIQALTIDDTGVRWPESELVDWINDAQREIVLLRPGASATNEKLDLVLGTKQTLPSAAVLLLNVKRNLDKATGVGKRSVRRVDQTVLDEQIPDWHDTSVVPATEEVKHYLYDEDDPLHFYVYPANDSTGSVEVVYSSNPAEVTAGDNLSLPDIYANAVVDYAIARAFSKDAKYAANEARVAKHMQLFMQSLGIKSQVEVAASPKLNGSSIGTPIGGA